MRVEWPLPVLFEDDRVLAVDKPAGLLSVPASRGAARNAADLVRRAAARAGLFARPVHRLDRDTSGVLLFALDPAALRSLEEAFRRRRVAKRYLALVHGRLRQERGEMRGFIEDLGKTARLLPRPSKRARPALTRFRVRERFERATLVEVEPVTGRMNQIRVHFAAAGHPLVGERKYARASRLPLRASRPLLHASNLAFPHPRERRLVEVRAPLPEDFRDYLARLRR